MPSVRILCTIVVLWTLALVSAHAQSALQHADLGQCSLENGGVIEDCQLGYRTAGTLNANRSNAVLFPTWFTGTSEDLLDQIGPEGLVDSSRHYVVLVDALGNGASSSPSNSTAQADSAFPTFTTRDMVDTQRRLLTEKLGIDSLHAVVGISMGGMQAFAWMTRYPDFADRIVSIVGTPRLTPQDDLLWRAELGALQPALDGPASERRVTKTVAAIHALHLQTPQALARMDTSAYRQFLREQEGGALDFGPYNWASQLRAMLRHDVTRAFGGSLARTGAAVQADALIVTFTQDHMVNPRPARRFAEHIGANQLALDSPCGHVGPGCRADTVNATVSRFLRAE